MKKYLKLMRVHHYLKNLLVFAALACSGRFFEAGKARAATWGFAAFCLLSSAVYILNDIRDCPKDRLHPVKCHRPIASGEISVKNAWGMVGALLTLAGACNAAAYDRGATLLLVLYLVLNLAYSQGLKNVPLVDVTILVAGFLIRVLYGAILTGTRISYWFYFTVISAAFYFSLGKRRNELKQLGGEETRGVLRAYPVGFLNMNMYMCLALTNVFYALWTVDENTAKLYRSNDLMFTVPLVLLITMKYSLAVEGDSDGDPVEVLLHDRALLAMCALYLLLVLTMLY